MHDFLFDLLHAHGSTLKRNGSKFFSFRSLLRREPKHFWTGCLPWKCIFPLKIIGFQVSLECHYCYCWTSALSPPKFFILPNSRLRGTEATLHVREMMATGKKAGFSQYVPVWNVGLPGSVHKAATKLQQRWFGINCFVAKFQTTLVVCFCFKQTIDWKEVNILTTWKS